MKTYTRLGLGALALVTACASACSSDSAEGPGGGTYDGPLYAMMVQVYSNDDRTVYLALSHSPDIDTVPLGQAREFAGVANFAEIGGKLLVSDGSAPKITEFDVSDELAWKEGRTVSFADYPLSDNANFYYQFVVDEHTALLPFAATKRIVWDPADMKITGTLDDTTLASQEPDLLLEAGGNRNSVHYDGSVLQAFFYHDDDWYDYGARSHVVVYDATTLHESRVLDIPCPALSLATRDEQGNTYFSTWGLPTPSILGEAPACIAKVTAAGTLGETIDLRSWTGGRLSNNFRYVGNGKAFANVLHHEELGVASPDQLSPTVLESLWESGPHWRLWLFDMEARTARPVDGIDVAIGSGAQFAVLDGRTFVFLPYDDWGRTKIYELLPDGTAVPRIDTVGDVFKWVRVR